AVSLKCPHRNRVYHVGEHYTSSPNPVVAYHTQTNNHMCLHTHTHAHTHTYKCTYCIYTQIHNMRAHTHTYKCTYCMYTQIHNMHTHTYKCTYCIYTQILKTNARAKRHKPERARRHAARCWPPSTF